MALNVTSVLTINCPPSFLKLNDEHRFRCQAFVTFDNDGGTPFEMTLRLSLREQTTLLTHVDSQYDVPPGASTHSVDLPFDYRANVADGKIVNLSLIAFTRNDERDVKHVKSTTCYFSVE